MLRYLKKHHAIKAYEGLKSQFCEHTPSKPQHQMEHGSKPTLSRISLLSVTLQQKLAEDVLALGKNLLNEVSQHSWYGDLATG